MLLSLCVCVCVCLCVQSYQPVQVQSTLSMTDEMEAELSGRLSERQPAASETLCPAGS